MRTSRLQFRRGFTLIELVLVLLVIALVVGVAAPTLRGFSRGARLRDTADQFITLTRLARAQALATGQTHRVTLGDGKCAVLAQDGQQLVELNQSLGGSFAVAEGVSMQLTDLQGGPKEFVEFYSTGRTQPARMRIAMADGDGVVLVECVTATEGFNTVSTAAKR